MTTLAVTLEQITGLLSAFEVLRSKSPVGGRGQADVTRATVMRILDDYFAASPRGWSKPRS